MPWRLRSKSTSSPPVAVNADKQFLFSLLYEAREAPTDEKAEAWDRYYKAIDAARSDSAYSRSAVTDALYKTGFREYAARRKLAERSSL
jgi:hypothetical protein